MRDLVTLPDVALDPKVARRLDTLAKRLDRTIEERDQLIVEAHGAGAGLREIARAVGMTHVGVRDIVRRQVEHIKPYDESDPTVPNLAVLAAEDHKSFDAHLPGPEDDKP